MNTRYIVEVGTRGDATESDLPTVEGGFIAPGLWAKREPLSDAAPMTAPHPCAKCPTCGRRPSERWHGYHGNLSPCPDPIHDTADRAPEIVARLERVEKALQAADDSNDHPIECTIWLRRGQPPEIGVCNCYLRDFRTALKGQAT